MKTRKNKLYFNTTAFNAEILTDASAPPKSPNEGGTTASEYSAASQSSTDPRLIIRGESFSDSTNTEDGESHELCSIVGKVFVVTTPIPKIDGEPFQSPNLQYIVFDLIECLGSSFASIKNRMKGLHGWKNSIQFGEGWSK
jgi:hypothetical protein